ncbi:MAG: primosomal protein N' [candidate division WOR-3 bacterium]
MKYYKVSIPIDKFSFFTYKAQETLDLKEGSVVQIPFKNRKLIGVVVEEANPFEGAKEIEAKIIDLPEDLFNLCKWVSMYYVCPLGIVLSFCIPPIMKRVREIKEYPKKESKIELNPYQKEAYKKIIEAVENEQFKVFLLFGVTGSGKTEIYLRVMEKVINKGKSVLYLVPEISIIPQVIDRIRERFGTCEEYHYKSSKSMRYSYWMNALNGNLKIGVGSRMSVFSPFKNLGLIIVDEEHSESYHQEDPKPRFSARDLAVMRGKIGNFPVILGSATPSIESFYNAEKGKYELLHLPERVEGMTFPSLKIVNPKGKIFSEEMKKGIEEALMGEKPSRVILFLNRRGYAPYGKCYNCGWAARCSDCDISLTLHKISNSLICHHCGKREKKIENCPICNEKITYLGWGTERIEEEIKERYKNYKIRRMDTDSISRPHTHKEIYEQLKRGEIQILLGTQMVTKGFDFPDIGFVGVLSADTALDLPDYRATERTFQLLFQVAGRAGRGVKGKVLIQSTNPNHYAIKNVLDLNYLNFYKEEIKFRESANYPPFVKLGRIVVKSKKIEKAEQTAIKIKETIKNLKESEKIILLGPAPCPIGKIEGYFRFHLLLKAKEEYTLPTLFRKLYENKTQGVKISFEIDPLNML